MKENKVGIKRIAVVCMVMFLSSQVLVSCLMEDFGDALSDVMTGISCGLNQTLGSISPGGSEPREGDNGIAQSTNACFGCRAADDWAVGTESEAIIKVKDTPAHDVEVVSADESILEILDIEYEEDACSESDTYALLTMQAVSTGDTELIIYDGPDEIDRMAWSVREPMGLSVSYGCSTLHWCGVREDGEISPNPELEDSLVFVETVTITEGDDAYIFRVRLWDEQDMPLLSSSVTWTSDSENGAVFFETLVVEDEEQNVQFAESVTTDQSAVKVLPLVSGDALITVESAGITKQFNIRVVPG